MQDFTEDLRALRTRLSDAEKYLSIDAKRARLGELDGELGRADLWEDQDNARAVTTEHGRLSEDVRLIESLERRIEDADTLYHLGVEEGDDSVEPEVADALAKLGRSLDDLELRSLFT